MANNVNFKPFNPNTVPLQGCNLIEASAGTGKTYSIAILLIRILIEQKITIKEILLVTFTKAAVAELHDRVRLFVRLAYEVSNNQIIDDVNITNIVTNAIQIQGVDAVQNILNDAITFLDEVAVLTIHGFCQQTLTEFAFETNQLFNVELTTDAEVIIEKEVNNFWRKNVTSIPVEILQLLIKKLNRKNIIYVVKNNMEGKIYQQYSENQAYVLDNIYFEKQLTNIKNLESEKQILYKRLIDFVDSKMPFIKQQIETNNFAKKHFIDVQSAEQFIILLEEKISTNYVEKLFAEILEMYEPYGIVIKKLDDFIDEMLDYTYYAAINFVTKSVAEYKMQQNQLSFDDVITNLHTALVKKKSTTLQNALQQKYKAVFIDEFQDTDKLQYEIFSTAFSTNTILFYIGDPKQSIYAWRKADINTYFKAYVDADNCYSMNVNFRSTERYIEAMNIFFKPTESFDTFYFADASNAINYIPVIVPANSSMGNLVYKQKSISPISIQTQLNKNSIQEAVTAQIVQLLSTNDYNIVDKNGSKKIIPSDIGILVRTNKEANEIKNSLAKYGIPAITIGDDKVLQSNEAKTILYILEALINIDRNTINKALLNNITGFTVNEILLIDDEKTVELFKKYKNIWNTETVYNALHALLKDFGVQHNLLHHNIENGERILTNCYQIIELLYKTETAKQLSQQELISWLKRSIETKNKIGDEHEQRIENDEDCIKIVTIHKSKGLEYNIVLAPYLDFGIPKNKDFVSFKNQENNYVYVSKNKLTEAEDILYKTQDEQENRRLIYVAITRAVYACFLYNTKSSANTTLSTFVKEMPTTNSLIEIAEKHLEIPNKYFYKTSTTSTIQQSLFANKFKLQHYNWGRLSYTSLALKNDHYKKLSSSILTNTYDNFIFNELTKGSKTGLMLHEIFENINFTNSELWPKVIAKSIHNYFPTQDGVYEQMLFTLVQHVLDANISIHKDIFTLLQVTYDKRIHEFEFDLKIKPFNSHEILLLSTNEIQIQIKDLQQIEGIMNGKIDMLFEINEKYYVLDWKSTHLGSSLTNYEPLGLGEAMNDNNYHLQYLIYTVATVKYLQSRIPNFDYDQHFGGVIYLFVRGMRAHTNKGVFTCKPTLAQIQLLDSILV